MTHTTQLESQNGADLSQVSFQRCHRGATISPRLTLATSSPTERDDSYDDDMIAVARIPRSQVPDGHAYAIEVRINDMVFEPSPKWLMHITPPPVVQIAFNVYHTERTMWWQRCDIDRTAEGGVLVCDIIGNFKVFYLEDQYPEMRSQEGAHVRIWFDEPESVYTSDKDIETLEARMSKSAAEKAVADETKKREPVEK